MFIVEIHHQNPASISEDGSATVKTVLWDRKIDGGFPETKVRAKIEAISNINKALSITHSFLGTQKASA